MQQPASITFGKLFIVATPIGNLQDITFRAVHVLRQVDLIVAEDTRHTQKLLQHLAIQKPLFSLHAHNEQQQSEIIIEKLLSGQNIALVSDAGTPLISDPGMPLVKLAIAKNIVVSPIPGASAVIAALSASGLPCDTFLFRGFLPASATARRKVLEGFNNSSSTVIFYEAPHRIVAMIEDLLHCCGESRCVVIAKEITKIYETFYQGTVQQVLDWLQQDPNHQRGEFVILLAPGVSSNETELDPEVLRILGILLQELPLKQAVKLTAAITGEHKNKIYDVALGMK